MITDFISRAGMLVLLVVVTPLLAATTTTTQPAITGTKECLVPTTQPFLAHPTSAPASQAVRTFAIPITETTISGNVVMFPVDYPDKLVLVSFWASWCPHSRAEIRFWKEAYKKYHDRGLEIIGISTDKKHKNTAEQLKEFLQKNDMPWEQVYDNSSQLSVLYQIESLPTSLLVDGTTGEVLVRGQQLRRAGLAQQIEKYLKKPEIVHATTKPS